MTDSEYRAVVKLLLEQIEKSKDTIFEQRQEIEDLKAENRALQRLFEARYGKDGGQNE
jgi:hypothetical protein